MIQKSNISWTEYSFNPMGGCRKYSEGCLHCYAEQWAARLAAAGNVNYQTVITDGKFNNSHFFDYEKALQPSRWRVERVVFVCSMCDLFTGTVPKDFIEQVFEGVTMNHEFAFSQNRKGSTFFFLTKRAKRMQIYAEEWIRRTLVSENRILDARRILLGTTVESSKHLHRIRHLYALKALGFSIFASFEPLLDKITLLPEHKYLDYIIVGAESGDERRFCHIENIRSIVQQAQRMNIPVHVKQVHLVTGGGVSTRSDLKPCDERTKVWTNHRLSQKPEEWPEDLRVRENPKCLQR